MRIMVHPQINTLRERNHIVSVCMEYLCIEGAGTVWVFSIPYFQYMIGDTLYITYTHGTDGESFEPYVPPS